MTNKIKPKMWEYDLMALSNEDIAAGLISGLAAGLTESCIIYSCGIADMFILDMLMYADGDRNE